MTAPPIEAAGSVPWRARAFAAGQVCTAGALLVTAPSGRLTELDAWWAGWFTLLVISVPALFLWSDLWFRSVVVVWSVAVVLVAVGSFGYAWWPLVVLPFAWAAAGAARPVPIARSYALVGAASWPDRVLLLLPLVPAWWAAVMVGEGGWWIATRRRAGPDGGRRALLRSSGWLRWWRWCWSA